MASTYKVEHFDGRVGMELWTYHRELQRDLLGTLKTIRELGFTEVETSSFYGLWCKQCGREDYSNDLEEMGQR